MPQDRLLRVGASVGGWAAGAIRALRAWEPGTLWIVWIILFLYALPLLITFSDLLVADLTVETSRIYVTGAITKQFMGSYRETFGTIVVPLLTAFAIKSIDANGTVPARTFALFVTLSGLFVVSIATSGILVLKPFRENIEAHDTEIYQTFVAAAQTYSKELLMYIALTIGISLKKP